tara:strand:- start:4749 stop:6344 length:1596 start_codon:yes stop_codon:yes gene_type:complete
MKNINFLICAWLTLSFVHAQHDEFNVRVIADHIYAEHLYRDKLLKDPYRPLYHYVIPEGMAHPFDPNGAFYWKGRYHLFYIIQTVRPKPFYRGDAWAHISSHDLIHWKQHPTALKPTDDTPERAIYSGNMFLNKKGIPTIMYQGLGAGNSIAISAGDDWLDYWDRHPNNPVIPYAEYSLDNDGAEYRTILDKMPDYGQYDIWDPHCWLDGDTYYTITGNNELWPGKDALFKSKNLKDWELLGDFFHHEPIEGTLDCPDFFRLGEKFVLLYLRNGLEYVIGDFKAEQFYPEKRGTMTWNIGAGYAPESLVDYKGRRIMWAALNDSRTGWGDIDNFITKHAWAGTLTLPRELSLDENNNLKIKPIDELKVLRYDSIKIENLNVNEEMVLEKIRGNSMELKLSINPRKAEYLGIKVCASVDGQEETVLTYYPSKNEFKIDLTKSSLNNEYMEGYLWEKDKIQKAKLSLGRNENLDLRIFIDRSVIEVFVNEKLALVQRIYPVMKESDQVILFSNGGSIQVPILESWKLHPSNPY